MVEYFIRRRDPLAAVYEVDFDAGTWRLAASNIGVVPDCSGELLDNGDAFRTDAFTQAWPTEPEADGVVTFTTKPPEET
jgi:hypothetical protein